MSRWLRSTGIQQRIGLFAGNVRQFQLEVTGIRGIGESGIHVEDSLADHSIDLAVKVLHAFLAADAHRIQQGLALRFAFFYILASAQRGFQDLDGSHASASVLTRNESLRNDVAKALGQTVSDRMLFRVGKYSSDSFDGL